MSKKRRLGLEDAYAVKTPADSIRLYGNWADRYESEFVADHGYVAYLDVARYLADHLADRDVPILDVGCGTGVCGVALRRLGFRTIDGIDISREMLREAEAKRGAGGEAVYRHLLQADLTKAVPLADASFGGLVSAGTFTHGHLGPESLNELWRIAAPGATCAIGINASHFREAGFGARIAGHVAAGAIDLIGLIEIDTYEEPPAGIGDGDDQTRILVCTVGGPNTGQS